MFRFSRVALKISFDVNFFQNPYRLKIYSTQQLLHFKPEAIRPQYRVYGCTYVAIKWLIFFSQGWEPFTSKMVTKLFINFICLFLQKSKIIHSIFKQTWFIKNSYTITRIKYLILKIHIPSKISHSKYNKSNPSRKLNPSRRNCFNVTAQETKNWEVFYSLAITNQKILW